MSVGFCSKHDTRGGGQFSINEQLTVDIFFDASLHFNKDTVHYKKKKQHSNATEFTVLHI